MIYDICRSFICEILASFQFFSFTFKNDKNIKKNNFGKVKKVFKHEIKLFLNTSD